MMSMTREQVMALAAAVGVRIPDTDLDSVTIRLGALLEAMRRIEDEMGGEMDSVEPVPPVFDDATDSG